MRKARARSLRRILKALRDFYGKLPALPAAGPFELILRENVAYLAEDARREEAFRMLKERVGLSPEKILAASRTTLHKIARHGIVPATTVEKLREIARIALEDFGGDLEAVGALPLKDAKKALRRFPSIGEPGAEKVLLFCGFHPVLALDSNGLRVLLRLGFGKEGKSYASSYRSAQQAAGGELPKDCGVLIEAYRLLRRHGRELCKRTHPRCETCPVARECAYYRSLSASA
jgi:endonuclease III